MNVVPPFLVKKQMPSGIEIAMRYMMFLDSVFGMYFDCCSGVEIFAQRASDVTAMAKPGARIHYGDADPNSPNAQAHHTTTLVEIKERNKRGGSHQKMLSQACIVFIYSVWDEARVDLGKAFGVPTEKVISNVFGDLRQYRNAIAHNGGKLEKRVEELSFVRTGQTVALTREQMVDLFKLLFAAVNQVLLDHTGVDHGFKFERGRL